MSNNTSGKINKLVDSIHWNLLGEDGDLWAKDLEQFLSEKAQTLKTKGLNNGKQWYEK